MSYIGQLEGVRSKWLGVASRVILCFWLCGCAFSNSQEHRSTTYYYGNGSKQFRFETENGVRTGLFTRWYKEGTIESECERRSESLLRRCKYYFPEGTLFRETEYSQDGLSGIEREWFSNGTLRSEGRTRDRQRAGLWYFWSRDGEDAWTVKYTSGVIESVEPEVVQCPTDNAIEAQTRQRSRHFLTAYWCDWAGNSSGHTDDSNRDAAGEIPG